ncbi:glycoside hydrolase 97 [Halalkalicoccus paucihalophilus]|uniref:Glycoside hydrolase 97 n=1 Tax=Halalkalicoccus paucihalophilus TaxID=1008153 RepID=A0A151AAG2_9EURY|nr:glycoside hydrolase family 97 protein [Halalkalicoccus paucihalophilus]KYH24540.1 glycoside hydrolase 97 [Halalkalicoccus paucihalophilus]
MVNTDRHGKKLRKDTSNGRKIVDEAEESNHLPITRRSVLQGAAALGPVAGIASIDEFSRPAAATSDNREPVSIASPDESIEATVELGPSTDLNDDLPSGQIASLTVDYDETTVIEPSPLGITTYMGQFVTSLSLENQHVETVTQEYETIGGDESGPQTLHARIGLLTFGSPNGVMQLELAVSNEGVAYRYHLPGEGHVLVDKEVSAFQIPEGSTAWLHEFANNYEGLWEEKDVESAGGNFAFPCLFEVDDETYTLVTEANVNGSYCASHLAAYAPPENGESEPRPGIKDDQDEIVPGNEEFDYDENSTLFELRFAGTYGLPQVVDTTLPLATPWRVAIVGDLPTVVESDLVAALSDPSEVEDTSWIKPGIVNWSWWSDGDSPRDFETQKEYVDYAAEQGWEYTLVDRGWRREWMPDLVEYANERDVGIIAWMVWYDLDTETKRERLLSQLKSWGVSGIKIDYMNADRQDRMQWYDDILEATAKHELLVNFHGSTLPKGRRRTWPHLLTSEAVRGAESYGWEEMPPSHNLILPYTRNVVGPMDYTPVTLSSRYEDAERAAETTRGHELALSVVFQSDLQHLADSVESYRSYPVAEQFLSEVAAVWDETIFIDGYPGEEITVARCDGTQWFIGHISAGDRHTTKIPLSFLPDDQQYNIIISSDTPSTSSLHSRTQVSTADATISVSVPENGGFVAQLSPRD